MIEVNKKEKESAASVIRRFTKKVKQSSVLTHAKARRFNQRPLSALKKKKEALKRVVKEKRYKLLMKLGKIKSRQS